jgi:hypothetical protein
MKTTLNPHLPTEILIWKLAVEIEEIDKRNSARNDLA